MPALAGEFYDEQFCACKDWTFGDMNPADGFFVPQMQGQRPVHFGAVEYAVAHHHQRAAHFFTIGAFFGRLEAEFDIAFQLMFMFVQDLRHGQPDGGVTVVSAGVHHAGILG